MQLQSIKREAGSKKETNQLRRDGYIPANLYVKGKAGESLAVNTADFNTVIRTIKKGHLPTTILTLVESDKKTRNVIVKEIQYHVTSYEVLHLDFEEITPDAVMRVKVPIECENIVDCAGIKQGGALRQPIRLVQVECLGKEIPPFFPLDVRDLGMKQSKRIKDLQIPAGVKLRASPEEVVAVIAKR